MKNKILSNISFNFLLRIITYIFSAITILYVARVLQPEAFGRISFAGSIAGYFIMAAGLGMPIYGMRCCAQERGARLNKVFSELWGISFLLSLASTVAFLIVMMLVPRLRGDLPLLLIYGSGILFQMIGCEWLYRGLEKFRLLAVVAFLCKAISLALILCFVRAEGDVLLYAGLSVLASYGSSIICFLLLSRFVDVRLNLRINTAHFKPLLVFFLMSCAVYIYSSLDLSMLGFMKGDLETGLYSIAAKGKGVLALTGGLVWNSILPIAANLWRDGKKREFESLAAKALAGVCGVQALAAVVCFLFAKQIILIVGGSAYLSAVPVFRILLLCLVPIGASNILGGQVLIPAGKEKLLLTAEVIGAVFNFFANFLLIPRFSIIGAAITTVVSEVIVWIVCLYSVKRDLGMNLGWVVVRRTAGYGLRKAKSIWIKAESRVRGDKLPYYCPCCDTHLRRFVAGAFLKSVETYDTRRYERVDQSVVCPVCGSYSRHRILVTWLDEHIDEVKGKRILHFAQERSVRRWMERNGIKTTTADLFNPADLKIDIEDTGLEGGSYDIIICNHVLEHVNDFGRALDEVYRILTPGGALLCSFPMDKNIEYVDEEKLQTDEERRLRFGQIDHNRVFGMKAEKFLVEAGFSVEVLKGEDYPDSILPVIGPADYDMNILFCCMKPTVALRNNFKRHI